MKGDGEMKKKNLFIGAFITILCFTFLTSSTWAGKKHRHLREGITIGVGAVMLGHALFNQDHRHFHPAPPYIHWPPPRFRGHWEVRRVWIPPTYERVWNPGHYDHKGRWVPGRWIEVVKVPGYWSEKRVWVGRPFPRYSHYY